MRNSFSSFGALLCGAFVAISFSSPANDTLDIWRWRNPLPSGSTRGSIAFLNNQFVVITSGPGVLTSPDGTNWTDHSVLIDGTLNQITYGNGHYVAVGSGANGGLIATSTDLANWTTNAPGIPYPLNAVAFGDGVFAVVGSIGSVPSNNYAGYLITSTDGVNWTLRASPSNSPITDIVYGAGKFVAALNSGQGEVLVSDNGSDWSFATVSSGRNFTQLSFASGKFFASGLHYLSFTAVPDLSYSADGLTWHPASDPRPTGLAEFQAVSGNGLLLGINGTSIDPLSSSIDGSNFTSFAANNYLYSGSVAFGNGVFVNSSLQASQDGTNWSPSAISPATGLISELLQNSSGYVVIASPLLVSSNGLKFSVTTNTMPIYPGRVRFANGLYHGVRGGIVRSTNGLDWELRNSATTQILNDIEFGNSLWVAVGNNGTITASTTGNAWSLRTSGTAVALNGIIFANNLFVVVGQSGTVLTSTDGNS